MCLTFIFEKTAPKETISLEEEDEELKRAAEILLTLKKVPLSESAYELRNRSVLKYSSVYPSISR